MVALSDDPNAVNALLQFLYADEYFAPIEHTPHAPSVEDTAPGQPSTVSIPEDEVCFFRSIYALVPDFCYTVWDVLP